MKTLTLLSLCLLWVNSAIATVDGHSRAYIVVQNIQSEAFFVERAPIIGCYGLAKGPQLAQFTGEYKVKSSIGCGIPGPEVNLNYLTCAKVVSAKESADFSTFREITLDISNCAAKNNNQFLKTVHTAAQMNFPQKTGLIKLILID